MAMIPGSAFEPARAWRVALLMIVGMLAIYIEAAPLGVGSSAPPSPDLLLCVVVYWAARRPGSTPLLAVFALGLARDLVTDVPPGAGALALVLAAETIRSLHRRLARGSFLAEWLVLAAAAFGAAALMWLTVLVTLAQPPYLADLFHQCL